MSSAITSRHARACTSKTGGRCNCSPTYQAAVYDKQAGKRIYKTFSTRSAAKKWRRDAAVAVDHGDLSADRGPTLRDATEQWLKAMKTGHERNRSGDTYKPSAIRSYRYALDLRVWPTLGDLRVREIRAQDVQRLVDDLVRDDLAPATIDGTVTPLKAFYRRALVRGEVNRNPTTGIIKPAVRQNAQIVAPPAEIDARLAALDGEDRAIWALGFYAGLRRSEMIGLRVEEVDLASGVIRVERGWDMIEGEVAPKSRQGRRSVPVPAPLRDYLDTYLLTVDRQRVFRSQGWVAKASDRAGKAWKDADLHRVTLHDARHTYASLMIAAGVNAKALSTFMGHANIQVTFDKYGHLFPGSEAEAASLLDAYLARDAAGSTVAQTVAQEAQTA